MGIITFTPDKLKQLEKAKVGAVKEGRSIFVFEGEKLLVDYAEYLIEYLRGKFRRGDKEVKWVKQQPKAKFIDAPIMAAPARAYTYKFRCKPRSFLEFFYFIRHWREMAIGEVRRLPGSASLSSHNADDTKLRTHFHKFAREAGLYAGLHYGIQRDERDDCLKITKFREASPGLMREDHYLE